MKTLIEDAWSSNTSASEALAIAASQLCPLTRCLATFKLHGLDILDRVECHALNGA